MTVPTGDHVPSADAAEQRLAADEAVPTELPADLPDDAAEGDAVEQALPTGPAGGRVAADLPLEADAADAAEQAHVVPFDEDEGRA